MLEDACGSSNFAQTVCEFSLSFRLEPPTILFPFVTSRSQWGACSLSLLLNVGSPFRVMVDSLLIDD